MPECRELISGVHAKSVVAQGESECNLRMSRHEDSVLIPVMEHSMFIIRPSRSDEGTNHDGEGSTLVQQSRI